MRQFDRHTETTDTIKCHWYYLPTFTVLRAWSDRRSPIAGGPIGRPMSAVLRNKTAIPVVILAWGGEERSLDD